MNGAVSKTVRGPRVPRGFESHPLRWLLTPRGPTVSRFFLRRATPAVFRTQAHRWRALLRTRQGATGTGSLDPVMGLAAQRLIRCSSPALRSASWRFGTGPKPGTETSISICVASSPWSVMPIRAFTGDTEQQSLTGSSQATVWSPSSSLSQASSARVARTALRTALPETSSTKLLSCLGTGDERYPATHVR